MRLKLMIIINKTESILIDTNSINPKIIDQIIMNNPYSKKMFKINLTKSRVIV